MDGLDTKQKAFRSEKMKLYFRLLCNLLQGNEFDEERRKVAIVECSPKCYHFPTVVEPEPIFSNKSAIICLNTRKHADSVYTCTLASVQGKR